MNCKDAVHIDKIDEFASDIFDFLESTAKDTLPTIGGQNKKKDVDTKKIPGWTENVKPFKFILALYLGVVRKTDQQSTQQRHETYKK